MRLLLKVRVSSYIPRMGRPRNLHLSALYPRLPPSSLVHHSESPIQSSHLQLPHQGAALATTARLVCVADSVLTS